jgi:hypothetical protein
VNQSYPGRAKYLSNVDGPTGSLRVAVQCQVSARTRKDTALVDTASQWCILPPSVALDLGYTAWQAEQAVDAAPPPAYRCPYGLATGRASIAR